MSASFPLAPPRVVRPIAIVAVAFGLLALSPAGTAALAADPFADFDAYAKAALADWNVPAMSLCVVKDGRVIFARGYGIRKLGGRDAVDADTVFPIASITKSFNATALAILVEEGKLHWTDPVTKHLPGFQLRDPCMTREVSIADLLSHRTGLDDPELLSYSGVTRDELLRRMRFIGQIAPFRTGNHYNNLGTIVAGTIVERVSGQSWSAFVRQRVLQPLAMHSTVPDVLELQESKNVATSYVAVGGQLQQDKSWTLPLEDGWRRYRETIRPAGAICSTANDMANFLTFHWARGEFRGRRILQADTILEMQALHSVAPLKQPPMPILTHARLAYGSGFGWQIRDYRGRKLVMHGGSTGTAIGLMPEEGIGVVVLTNVGSGMQYMVMHDILDRMLGIERTWTNREFIARTIGDEQKQIDEENARLDAARRKGVLPALPLGHYAGTYESELFGQLVVSQAGGALSIELGPNCRSKLVHWSGERFRATFVLRFPEDWFIDFVVDKGRAIRLSLANVFPRREIGEFVRVAEGEQRK